MYTIKASYDKYNPKDISLLNYISQFTFHFRYVLFRVAINPFTLEGGINMQQMTNQHDQSNCKSWSRSLKIERISLPGSYETVLCDVCTGKARPLVPSGMRRQVFDTLHRLSHSGVRATLRLIGSLFVWPEMNGDFRNWAKTCLRFQREMVTGHTKALLATFTCPDARFSHVHGDILCQLPLSQSFLPTNLH